MGQRNWRSRAWVIGLALAGVGSIAFSQALAPPAASFTEDQAARGKAVFDANCAACHGLTMGGGPGGPPLTGAAFRVRWDPQPAEAIFQFVRERMPPGGGGSLSDVAYADVLAYVLKSNGSKPGAVPLPADPAALANMTWAGALPPAPRTGSLALAPKADPAPDATAVAGEKARVGVLQTLRPVTDQMLRDPPPGSWLNWRRTYDAQGFSELSQIDRRNVASLRLAWSWQLAPGLNGTTPLVHDGVIFVVSAGRLQALNAATGDILWEYVRQGVGIVRNLAVYEDKIFLAAETHMVALDMRTGKVAWDRLIIQPNAGVSFAGGPLAAKGRIFQGVGGCASPYPGGCFLVALDARTGREAWRFNTIARPGQPGGDSWAGAPVDERYGGSVWIAGSYDPELDLLFFGTAQTYKIATLITGKTIGDRAAGLYTDSTLALRPDTGELVWHYQHLPGEVWDLDWSFERTLATILVDGKPRRTVTSSGKIALFDTLDARTGEYLFSNDVGLQNLVTAIDPKTGAKTYNPAAMPEPNVEKQVCTGTHGGRNWPATSYNPRTGILFVPLNEACMGFTWLPGPTFDYIYRRTPANSDGMVGRMQAIDLASRRTLWTVRERAPHVSAMLATAGGVVFEGTKDRWFRARDDRTGKLLWQTRLDAAPAAFPITYAVDGRQYVAVTTGGGAPLERNIGGFAPEIRVPSTGGSTLWVFELPARR